MTPVSKRLTVALAISVALNLLFIGAVVGRRLHHGGHHGPPHVEALGDGAFRHRGLRRELEGRRGDVEGRRTAVREARRRVRDALTTEPFDKPKLEEALRGLRTETMASQELLHGVIIEAAAAGTPERRRELSESFGERRRR